MPIEILEDPIVQESLVRFFDRLIWIVDVVIIATPDEKKAED